MKTLIRLLSLLTCAAAAGAPARAAVEPLAVEPEQNLQLPASLQMRGILEGRVVLAVSVDAAGRLTDTLVLGYTHAPLVPPCVAAIRDWTFQPARVDGTPVPAQVELTLILTPHGAVVSQSMSEVVEDYTARFTAGRLEYRLYGPDEIDAHPVRVTTVEPRYSAAAQRDGVSGRVTVHFYIDETGAVRMPCVEAGGHPYLAGIAVEAVRGWKFAPVTRGGRPVLVAAQQEFVFDGAK